MLVRPPSDTIPQKIAVVRIQYLGLILLTGIVAGMLGRPLDLTPGFSIPPIVQERR